MLAYAVWVNIDVAMIFHLIHLMTFRAYHCVSKLCHHSWNHLTSALQLHKGLLIYNNSVNLCQSSGSIPSTLRKMKHFSYITRLGTSGSASHRCPALHCTCSSGERGWSRLLVRLPPYTPMVGRNPRRFSRWPRCLNQEPQTSQNSSPRALVASETCASMLMSKTKNPRRPISKMN